MGDVRALVQNVPPRKTEWSLSGEPKATGDTFLLLSFLISVSVFILIEFVYFLI